MRWRGRNDRDGERADPKAMHDDRRIVQVAQNVDAKRVYKAVREENARVNADDLGRRRLEAALDGGERGDEVGTAEGDASGNGDWGHVSPAFETPRRGSMNLDQGS